MCLFPSDPSLPESDRNKIAIGASGLVLGIVLSAAGFIYYKKKSSGQWRYKRYNRLITNDSSELLIIILFTVQSLICFYRADPGAKLSAGELSPL